MNKLSNFDIGKRAEIIKEYNHGAKVGVIANAYDTTPGTVRNVIAYMKKHGVIIKNRRAPSKPKVETPPLVKKEGVQSDNLGFFILGVIVTLLVLAII